MKGMVVVSFRLPRALKEALDDYAERYNVTPSEFIRHAVRQQLERDLCFYEKIEREEEGGGAHER